MAGDLLVDLREHDLPPRWDGHAVVWLGWEYARPIFICPPPRPDVCEGCGMPTTERGFPAWSTNRGMVADSPRLTHADYEAEEAARARLPERVQHKLERHWWMTLIAYRCHSCSLDHVEDLEAREVWRLDHTDYGDDVALHIVLRRHTPYPIRIYQCPDCAGFHLTKRPTWEDKTA